MVLLPLLLDVALVVEDSAPEDSAPEFDCVADIRAMRRFVGLYNWALTVDLWDSVAEA